LFAHDPDGDGRFHVNEIISDLQIGYNFFNNLLSGVPEPAKTILSAMGAPLGLVDLHGEIDVRFFAYIEALFGAWRKEFDLVKPAKLLDFTVSIPEPPVLAEGHTINNTQDSKNTIADGVLRLNVGPYANNRVNGVTADGDESVFLKKTGGSAGDETIAVW